MPFKVKSKKSKVLTFFLNFYPLTCVFCLTIFVGQGFADQFPRYEIDATLDTANHKLAAKSKVAFTNNSQEELNAIYFHIYPHRKYNKKEIRFLYRYAGYFKVNPFPEGFQSGDLKIESVSSDGKGVDFAEEGPDQTILRINLDKNLKPGETVLLEISFSVDIPHSYGRFGWHKDIISLNRWYPLLSVLDKEGWHNYPFYLYHHPYFSDAAFYKVRLTLPQTEVVAATGVLKEERANSDGTKTIFLETEAPTRDFSLGISPNFKIFSIQKEQLKIKSYYLKGDQKRAQAAANYALELMEFYAQRFGEYPYKEFNIVANYLGYGGDQSSCLVFIDTRVYKLPGFLERYFDFLISHETGHQWFYNIIGSDEYRQMFVDEGINSYWLLQYLENKYGPYAQVMVLPEYLKPFIPNFSFRDSTALRYIYMAKNGLDRPVIGELSSFQEPSSIFALTYGKGAAILDMLQGQVGKEVFEKIVQQYSRQFRFRNSSLADLMQIVNRESGQNFNWFFDQWLNTAKACDYAVKKVSTDKIILENRGTVQMPVSTRITYEDGKEDLRVWDGKDQYHTIDILNRKVRRVELDPEQLISLDLDRSNNYWPRNFYVKPVPLYFFAYEIPVFLPRDSYNIVAGPNVGGSSLGVACSAQKAFDGIFRVNSAYDFNGKAIDSRLGYELAHLFNKQISVGFEVFDYESSKDGFDVSGGKIYLRKELWPSSYGIFDSNDHLTFYFIRDQKLESTDALNGREEINNLHYLRKNEAIAGIAATFGRYGPYSDPDYGWKFIPTQEFAGHFLGGKDSFQRSSVELNNYYLLFERYQHKLASKIKLGWGNPSDKKLFQLGGPDGLRGYGRKTIEGSRMVLSSLEYRFPLASELKIYFMDNVFCLSKIQIVGFGDLGRAWYGDFSQTDFKKDVGLGLCFHFDMVAFLEKAVFRIDIAEAINEPKEDHHVWFRINQAF